MGIEEIVACRVLHQHGQRLPGLIPISQPRPEADGPGPAPTGISATVLKAALQRPPRSRHPLRRIACELCTGIERVEMRDMPLPGGRFLKVLRPLLQLSGATNLVRRQL